MTPADEITQAAQTLMSDGPHSVIDRHIRRTLADWLDEVVSRHAQECGEHSHIITPEMHRPLDLARAINGGGQ